MSISYSHKFIFIHIPKHASTGIKDTLIDLIENDEYLIPKNQHANALEHCIKYGKENFINFFKFTVMRNPWDRIVSDYYYLKTLDLNEYHDKMTYHRIKICKEQSFKYFVFQPCHYPPAYKFFTINNMNAMNFILRYENLENDFKILCQKLKIKKRKLKKVNASKKPDNFHYTDMYDEDTKNHIFNIYETDIKYFKYKFGK